MAISEVKLAPPSDDKRWRKVDATMRRLDYSPRALIETLHAVQDAFGYIDTDAQEYVSSQLSVPLSKVFGVTTFYNLFNTKPAGEHSLVLCTGTACYVKGNDQIQEFMKEKFNLNPGETTEDNKLSFIGARCVGACGLAPVMILDGKIMGKMSVDDMKIKIEEWLSNEA